jgi:hypothetical protein
MSKHQNGHKATKKNHSAKAQQQKLLDWLFKYGFISTITARKVLDIIYAPARICELIKLGYQIERRRIEQDGHKRITEYHLVIKTIVQVDLFGEVAK